MNLLTPGGLDLAALAKLCDPPPLFAPGDIPFWQDPRIAPQILATHLDPTVDLASRRPETIAATVHWIVDYLGLSPGARVLDLGCGPGLYCEALARRGMRVTGVDFSQSSIEYARGQAAAAGLAIEYLSGNYVATDFGGEYDAILLIFGDLCALADADRDRLLGRVAAALARGGAFVLDVTTPRRLVDAAAQSGWEAHTGPGFWRNAPHLVLTTVFAYPSEGVTVNQHVVIDADGEACVYRNWLRDYTEETLRALLAAHGLVVEGVFGDLTGTPVSADSLWLGAVGRPA